MEPAAKSEEATTQGSMAADNGILRVTEQLISLLLAPLIGTVDLLEQRASHKSSLWSSNGDPKPKNVNAVTGTRYKVELSTEC